MSLVFTHLLAACSPVHLYILYIRLARMRIFRKKQHSFWERQHLSRLQCAASSIPEPLNLMSELESFRTAVQAVAPARETGLLQFLNKVKGFHGRYQPFSGF
ncbi:MAG: hypothetical protein D6677_10070 [Calditrichaeota bacterium]|nr:MAG: hypothetical protein D6677_10070 [Calditrichota bacterium]